MIYTIRATIDFQVVADNEEVALDLAEIELGDLFAPEYEFQITDVAED